MTNKNKYFDYVFPHLDKITEWIKEGRTEYMIHTDLGIGHTTWNRYKNQERSLREAIKKGKQNLCSELQGTLYTLAKGGYKYTDEVATPKGEVVQVKKTLPPCKTSLIFALKNHMPNEYKDKREVDVSGEINIKGFARFFIDDEDFSGEKVDIDNDDEESDVDM